MLSFAHKHIDGVVPEPGDLDDEDRALLAQVEAGFDTVGDLYNACKFRAAPSVPSGQAWARRWPWPARPTATLRFTQCRPGPQGALVPDQGGSPGGSDQRVPHPARRGQPQDDPGADPAPHGAAAARVLGYNGQLFGTQQVVEYEEEMRSHRAPTYDHTGAIGTWSKCELLPGQPLRPPAPLFKKLDESVIEEEYARLEG